MKLLDAAALAEKGAPPDHLEIVEDGKIVPKQQRAPAASPAMRTRGRNQ